MLSAALHTLLPHPAFAPYRALAAALATTVDADALTAFNVARPAAMRQCFVAAPAQRSGALEYERRIAVQGEILTRADSVHDAMNALVWLRFPRSKAAISALHVALGEAAPSGNGLNGRNGRSRRRDALTLLDESGLVLCCAPAQWAALRALHAAHDWAGLFVAQRACFEAQVRPVVFGHGLLEQLAMRPHRGLTAKALWLPLLPTADDAALDRALVAALQSDPALHDPAALLPLPLLGLPGWFAENASAACYDDRQVFRPRRGANPV